jgi:EAL domain-containing protein (putative c-di-GMP-specific phosphodiesterase class I)/GGDEF domain-containing protein
MSLIKQLWLAILLIIALAFGASFIINMATSKNYLEQQLEMKNTDNAVSLALSISQMEKDPVAVNLMLSAQFDNGHYEYIRLTDPNNQLMAERVNEDDDTTIPSWFKRLINISPNPGVAQIQDGWTQYGVLSLASSTNFAYLDLWDGTRWMLLWSAIIAIACGVIGTLMLKIIVDPLHEMVAMTEAIGDKKFISIKEPNTLEFKSLARALNQLSQKIKDMLTDESALLEQMRLEANYDEITGLMNRKYFSSRVAAYIENVDEFTQGVLVVCHINNLAEINNALGSAATDSALKRMGLALQSYCHKHPAVISGRLTGADFAVFSSEPVDHHYLCGQVEAALIEAAGLQSQFDAFALHTKSSGVKKSEQLDGLKQLISTIRSKTNTAEADIMNLIHQQDATIYESHDKTTWRTMLTSAIQDRRLKLASYPVVSNAGRVIHYESPVRLQLTADGPWLAAGEFIAWANQLSLAAQLDLLVLETAIQTLAKDESMSIAVNVSTNAMFDGNYLALLNQLLSNNKPLASRLWLEVTEQSAFKNLPQFLIFCAIAEPFGCKLGVKHVGAQISRLGELHDLNLDYIKVDASIIRNIDKNPGNKAFLKGLCLIAHSIGLIAIAEGVQREQELATLPELGIDASTGPIIK